MDVMCHILRHIEEEMAWATGKQLWAVKDTYNVN